MTRHAINRYLRALVPAVLLVAAACTLGRRGPTQAPAVLIFKNESLEQANVYAVAAGLNARRIGTVFAGRTDTLVVPADLVTRGTFNIVARLSGRSAAQTGPVSVRPGEQYEVRLDSNARLLSFLPTGP